jgi:hypothetical protein
MSGTVDGKLHAWSEIAERYEWLALLLGNGLSAHVWGRFAYGSLYEEARALSGNGLSPDDQALFRALETENFERILGELSTAIRVLETLGREAGFLYAHYRSVQMALGHAVRAVHAEHSEVPADSLRSIKAVLECQEWVFTTSYDLLLYWAMAVDGWRRLVDCFWSGRPRCQFDPDNADVGPDRVPVYFLHGAMHLVVSGSGVTRKLTRTALQNVLQQFGEPIDGDPQARPLLVTEGSSRDKLRAIEANAYLVHAIERLRRCRLPLVVFGSSLGEQDAHLVEALNEHPDRPIAVSMRPGAKSDLRARQAEIFGRLRAHKLLFFDATTHPLGSPEIAAARRGPSERRATVPPLQ